MITIEQVERWLVMQGISHVLASANHGWAHTACKIFTPSGDVKKKPGPRKCRKCIALLATATLRTERKPPAQADAMRAELAKGE